MKRRSIYGRMDAMNIKCLVLDHDDTTVNSTPCIHYPAFLDIMEKLRPEKHYTIEEFWTKNFSPGLGSFYRDELGFDEEEMLQEYEVWRNYVSSIAAPFFPGIPELIKKQKEAGGFVCVVSHSFPEFIRRDYLTAGVPMPDMIFGGDLEPEKNKPNPYPLTEIMRLTGCRPDEMLMVDDLKPGLNMARSCGVKFAACSWSYNIPQIRGHMNTNADYVLDTTAQLDQLLFSGAER